MTSTFLDRYDFLHAIELDLTRRVYSEITFVKCSPGQLDATSGLLGELVRQAHRGANVEILVSESAAASEWFRSLGSAIAGISAISLKTLAGSCVTPALIIGESLAYFHLAWPDEATNEGPYSGIRLIGDGVHPIARSVRAHIRRMGT